eukprot:jgi/Mesvir1/20816/Mv07916-RA.2
MEVDKGGKAPSEKQATAPAPASRSPASNTTAFSLAAGSRAATPREEPELQKQAVPSSGAGSARDTGAQGCEKGDAGPEGGAELATERLTVAGDSLHMPEHALDLAILQMMYTDLMLSHQALAASHRALLGSLYTGQYMGQFSPFGPPYGSFFPPGLPTPPPPPPPPSYYDHLPGFGYDAFAGPSCSPPQDASAGPPGSTWYGLGALFFPPDQGPPPQFFRGSADMADAGAPWGLFPLDEEKPPHPRDDMGHGAGSVAPPAAPAATPAAPASSPPAQGVHAHATSTAPAPPQPQRMASPRAAQPAHTHPSPPPQPRGEAPPPPPQELRQWHAPARPGLGGLLGGQPQAPAQGPQPGGVNGAAARGARRPLPERVLAFVNLKLIMKLVVLVFIMSQDGSRQKVLFWCLAAFLIYLYQIGALTPLRRWLMVLNNNPAMRVVPGGPGAAGANNDAAGANNPPGPRTLGGMIMGALWELQVLILGFFTSLLPGWNMHEAVPAWGGGPRPVAPPGAAAARAANNGRPREDDREHQD